MESAFVSFGNLMQEINRYANSVVHVKGILVVQDEKVYLQSEDSQEGEHLEITDQSFLDRLLDNVPCYVGGKFLYSDRVDISGYLQMNNAQPSLEDICRVCLSRGDETYTF